MKLGDPKKRRGGEAHFKVGRMCITNAVMGIRLEISTGSYVPPVYNTLSPVCVVVPTYVQGHP